MLTIRLVKYGSAINCSAPVATESYVIREASAVYVRYEADGRCVVQLGAAPGDTEEVTVGNRPDCSYHVAYVMNQTGRTVDKIS